MPRKVWLQGQQHRRLRHHGKALEPKLQQLSRACDPRTLKSKVRLFMIKSQHSKVQMMKADIENFTPLALMKQERTFVFEVVLPKEFYEKIE